MGKLFLSQWLCVSAIFNLSSCTDDEVVNQSSTAPLQVSVNTQGTISSRAIIHDEYLPDASNIGISLFTPEGEDYDNQGYFNVKYTASGTGESQTWAAQGTTPSISANEAYLMAYYPYNPDVETIEDLAAHPVENASQTDYMYAGFMTGITNANPKVNITMQHALTAIRVNLVLGDFTGDATVSNIAVKSPGLASEATLDIYNGALDNISGQDNEYALDADFTLSNSGTSNDVLFVPDAEVAEGTTTVSATIGGKKYTAGISFDNAYQQGYIYTYTLTLNNSGFQVTKVAVDPWKTGTDDSAQLEPEKDNAYIVKIVASYNEPEPMCYIEGEEVSYNNNISTVQSRSGDTFEFVHNVMGFVGTIDWGDGTKSTYDEPVKWPEHYYPNDGLEYIITAKGTMTGLSMSGIDGSYFKTLVKIGKDCGIKSLEMAFANSGLAIISKGALDGCTEVENFGSVFYNCTKLTEIPEGLFDKCTKATSFVDYEISENIGDGVQFYSCFGRCTELATIPERLFNKCTEVIDFSYVFRRCVNLQSIPTGLFDNCTKVTEFTGAFQGCISLTEIPEGLFDKCTEVRSFKSTFCHSYYEREMKITTIPEGLFDSCTKVTDFTCTFSGCSSLQTIPEGLFDYNTEVTSFAWTFENCDNLQTIPEGLFDNCTEVTSFSGTFNGCNALTGESPYTVIQVDGVETRVHLYERSQYPEHFTVPTSYSSCFYNCTGLTDYSYIPSGWK